LNSWKGIATAKLENGSPDRCDFYSISQGSILKTGHHQSHPMAVHESKNLLKLFTVHARDVSALILSHLDTHLNLPFGTLAQLHKIDEASKTAIRPTHAPPQPQTAHHRDTEAPAKLLVGHTDNGTITILFNVLGGLQILPPNLSPTDDSNWYYLRPEPNFAIVNVGDALCQWSGVVLRSGMHRVVSPPGEQAQNGRLSFGYVVKPSDGASMRRLVGGEGGCGERDGQCSYEEWLLVKGKATWEGKSVVRIGGTLKQGS
jgi:isopenicillin N synthase-like dioxygenase